MKDRAAIEALVDRLVVPENFGDNPTLDQKVALLSLVLEELKHERPIADNVVDFEIYTQSEIFADTDKLFISAPLLAKHLGAGTAPIQLQSPLLLFLLLHHRNRFRVLEIIQHFIGKVRQQLTYLDFKKTKTGVTRCFTNTRFAAHVLRDYGLLKFTQREAYKTWELSLTGFLVAADIFQKRSKEKVHWSIPSHFKEFNFDVQPEIRTACDSIKTYDEFVSRLASICVLDTEVFKTFEPALRKAYALLPDYWAMLNNPNLNQQDRRAASLERMQKLEREAISDEFYEEFAQCIQINELLAKISQQPQND
ncbi:MAG TPA: hypothetical protein VGO67_21370 [Verrucomicrobiae bacterium]|jgi:hypothetical protein